MISLLTGQVNSLVQNTLYALPAKRCLAFTDAASPTIVMGCTTGSTTAITLSSNNQFETCGGFIKLTSTGPINLILASPTA